MFTVSRTIFSVIFCENVSNIRLTFNRNPTVLDVSKGSQRTRALQIVGGAMYLGRIIMLLKLNRRKMFRDFNSDRFPFRNVDRTVNFFIFILFSFIYLFVMKNLNRCKM